MRVEPCVPPKPSKRMVWMSVSWLSRCIPEAVTLDELSMLDRILATFEPYMTGQVYGEFDAMIANKVRLLRKAKTP